ncbi:MAG: diacylglycerol kinase family lipid kinase [Chloroflexi bacterium]|nr:diacylglycerol kinase family lipid kinase [Chloroflexota bacterium]
MGTPVVRAQLIYNPAAGQIQVRRDLEQAVAYLEEHGWQVSWRETHGPSDGTTYAREAVASGCQVAIAVGGDGTVGEVADGLVGSQTALGVLPAGTSNVWAKEMGIPSASYLLHPQVRASLGFGAPWLLPAAELLVHGRRARVDVGRVNQRHFLMWAGVGLDARITEEVEQHPEVKRQLGRLAFIMAALYIGRDYRGVRAHVRVGKAWLTRRIIMAVVSNIQLYGGVVRISPLAQLDDGLLDACIFQGQGLVSTVRHLASVFAQQHLRDPEVSTYELQHMEIHPARPLPIHADGDFIGYTPAVIDVVPKALDVLLPASAPARLFHPEDGAPGSAEPTGLLEWLGNFAPYTPRKWIKRP